MKRLSLGVALSLAACSGSNPAGTTATTTQGASATSASGTSSGATTGANTTSGASSTTGATGASATSSGSGTSGTASTTSGNTTGQSTPCGQNAVWTGDRCLLTSCSAPNSLKLSCLLADGGAGTCIGGACNGSNLTTDSENCGVYGLTCPAGTVCNQGSCSNPDSGVYVECDAGSCPIGKSCVYGSACGTDNCANAQSGDLCVGVSGLGVCCGSTCADISTDSNNCGSCGNVCSGTAGCYEGACLADCSTAAPNAECVSNGNLGFCCNGTCDTMTDDPLNCGSCGAACPSPGTCNGYYCNSECQNNPSLCPAGTKCAFGSGNCVPTSCATLAEGSACSVTLANGQPVSGVCCGQNCLNTATDSSNCGGCGNACGTGLQCLEGQCSSAKDCAVGSNGDVCRLSNGVSGACCNGLCVDTATDIHNCGACDEACPAGSYCGGAQQAYAENCVSDAGSGSNDCNTSTCASGYRCNTEYWYCEPSDCSGLADGVSCLTDGGVDYRACCNETCASFRSDPLNCGACGAACPQGSTCVNFNCTVSCYNGGGTCPAGTVCTGSECAPLACAGRSNGDVCAFSPEENGVCCNGSCTFTEYGNDPNNCGSCGVQCGAGQLCMEGRCVSSTPATNCQPACASGEVCAGGVCVGSVCTSSGACAANDGAVGLCCGSGVCADLLSDATNCGGCGFACQPGAACQDGVCLGSQCTAAQENDYCGADANHVCCGTNCTDLSSDSSNCGYCGHACPAGQTCQAGTCAI